jgi:hypothetical protein
VNVGSSAVVTVPATAAVDATVPIQATATNITNPVYQVWIESPGGTWTQSGRYRHDSSYQFTPDAAGTYVVVVYAKHPDAPNTSALAVVAEASVVVPP